MTIAPERAKKLHVSEKHGVIYGFAGNYTKCCAFVRILESLDRLPWHVPRDEPQLDLSEHVNDDVYMLIMQWDERVFMYEQGYWGEVFGDFCATGSGEQAANAAMHMGADALKAVQIASKVDTGTDDRIVCFSALELSRPAHLSARARTPKPRSRSAPAPRARSKSHAPCKRPA